MLAHALSFAIAFVACALLTAALIPKMRAAGFVGVDINKVARRLSATQIAALKVRGAKGLPIAARGGGIAMIFAFVIATLIPLSLMTPAQANVTLLALLSILLVAITGMFEDFIPIRQSIRMLSPALAALPFIFMQVGNPTMALPLIGEVNFGAWYWLLLMPIGVIACSNLFNMLAGFNGLEAGSGAIVGAALLYIALALNRPEAAFLALALVGVCLSFLLFNWYPAKIFPGNAGTYLIGVTVVVIAIVGNMERAAIIAVMPQITEFFLKARSRFKAEVFGTLKRGRLHHKGEIYSLAHALMQAFRPTERQLVGMLLALQALFAALAAASISA